MTRSTLLRFGATLALGGVVLAACGGTSSSPSASVAAPSVAAESPSASASTESPSASAPASPSVDPNASPEARVVQMYAVEGAFQNAPVDPVPGTILTFRNLGTEAHEMVVVRRNDDATDEQTFTAIAEDLTKLDPTTLMEWVTVVDVLAADPGQESDGQIVLTETGDYAVLDLLATGTTTAPASPDPMAIPSGVPNVTTGMFTTFTVIEPEAS